MKNTGRFRRLPDGYFLAGQSGKSRSGVGEAGANPSGDLPSSAGVRLSAGCTGGRHCTGGFSDGNPALFARRSALPVRSCRIADQLRRSATATAFAGSRRRPVDRKRGDRMVGMEERTTSGVLCVVDDGVDCGSRIVGGVSDSIAIPVIHRFFVTFPQ